ncbi:hypothetical protein LINPERPRIM_LOCUS15477, partial [Linum perenne]
MTTIAWNCRGLGGDATVAEFKKLIRLHSPSFVFLCETRLSLLSSTTLFRSVDFPNFDHVEGMNNGGGISFAWADSLSCVVVFSTDYAICVCWEYEPSCLAYLVGVHFSTDA